MRLKNCRIMLSLSTVRNWLLAISDGRLSFPAARRPALFLAITASHVENGSLDRTDAFVGLIRRVRRAAAVFSRRIYLS